MLVERRAQGRLVAWTPAHLGALQRLTCDASVSTPPSPVAPLVRDRGGPCVERQHGGARTAPRAREHVDVAGLQRVDGRRDGTPHRPPVRRLKTTKRPAAPRGHDGRSVAGAAMESRKKGPLTARSRRPARRGRELHDELALAAAVVAKVEPRRVRRRGRRWCRRLGDEQVATADRDLTVPRGGRVSTEGDGVLMRGVRAATDGDGAGAGRCRRTRARATVCRADDVVPSPTATAFAPLAVAARPTATEPVFEATANCPMPTALTPAT